ncbi:glutaminase A [Cupriavidus metallidurans]|uniref:glutaminase A n=1 Tax=Cupriavidus TaxID=106589 RepID=UPI0002A2F4B7|nr:MULTISPECIES: glutaminase A [Cupriavidus]ELA01263.1 glutaminase [Cupriavidus sp. HMR-1]GMG92433.1 glutaminase [Cupriavidus sp. TKC]HBO81673.1 glutaminase [Cupriavidus sp.]
MNSSSAPTARFVSTGTLPGPDEIRSLVEAAYENFREEAGGKLADYIPALAEADPSAFGICVANTRGDAFMVGEAAETFSIQSVSKPFVFALVCEALGAAEAAARLGVDATGLPFNSIMAMELRADGTSNPLVNAGAIAATSLIPGSGAEDRWHHVRQGLSRFAGRELECDEHVYASEAANNQRNAGLAHLLRGHGRLYCDPDEAVEVYTRQCALLVSARDLALMGATLAGGGVHPLTGEQVVSAATCQRVLAVMATAGLYERSGSWLYDVGLPGKSGVSGGILTIAPGKGAVATFSPPLDAAGNSVRGQLVMRFLSERLGLNLFISASGAHL